MVRCGPPVGCWNPWGCGEPQGAALETAGHAAHRRVLDSLEHAVRGAVGCRENHQAARKRLERSRLVSRRAHTDWVQCNSRSPRDPLPGKYLRAPWPKWSGSPTTPCLNPSLSLTPPCVSRFCLWSFLPMRINRRVMCSRGDRASGNASGKTQHEREDFAEWGRSV